VFFGLQISECNILTLQALSSVLRVKYLGLLGILIIQLDFRVYLVFLDTVNSFYLRLQVNSYNWFNDEVRITVLNKVLKW